MAGFTKAPFYGAAYVKRGLVKGVALMPRASTQPRVEYVCGLLKNVLASIARSMQHSNQQQIAKLNEKIAAMTDGVELADLSALKERKIDQSCAPARGGVLHILCGASAHVRRPWRPGGADGSSTAVSFVNTGKR